MKVLDSNISHQQAITILQQAKGRVDLVVARGPETLTPTDPVIPSDWCQVEVIDLVNDGTGLGFGIIGGQQTGVVVKTILPGGVADRDTRLLPGDFILQINEHWLRGVASEQVASVLRSCGTCVRLVVARPVDPSDPGSVQGLAPVLPTSVLSNQEQLEAHLTLSPAVTTPAPDKKDILAALPDFHSGPDVVGAGGQYTAPLPTPAPAPPPGRDMPEVETMEVELVKDTQGLGITIAGYTCEREELSGIFVKSVTEGSAADRSGMVMVNDQIVEVDHMSLQGYTNQEAVEMLRSTGRVVSLRLVRYVHGLKFEQLQQAIASSTDTTPTAPSPAPRVVSPPATSSPLNSQQQELSPKARGMAPRPPQRTDSLLSEEITPPRDDPDMVVENPLMDKDYSTPLKAQVEAALKTSWGEVVGSDFEIIVAQIGKFKEGGGLGISLEGTVEKVDGSEQNPHHYIRSVLPNGPVGQDGRLSSGDELLEVNGRKLLGLYHSDVVAILKELPMHVRLVCARAVPASEDRPLQGSNQQADRLVKAKSDGSISSSMTATDTSAVMSRLKSRSLEPLTGLAMWAEEVITIELQKTERGLGFSILDYQDPLNPTESVIVIRSLVPGGVAQQDGRLIPGDRLMFVNNIPLENASLDTAVQALKGAAQGVVRIGVAKPLPVTDSQVTEGGEDTADVTEVRSIVSDMETDPGAMARQDSISSDIPDLPPPLPTSPIPEEEEVSKPSERVFTPEGSPVRNMAMPPMERLLGSTTKSMTVETRYEERTDSDNIPPLPVALEQKIKIVKDAESLGLQVDIEEGGVNGMVVRSLSKGGTLARDGRLQPGDYLVAVGGENMRSISHREALAVLRRTQLTPLGEEIPITYIPASDAVVFRTSILTQVTMGREPTQERRSVERQVTVGDVREKSNGTTVISIREKEPVQQQQAPLVSPEHDMSPDDASASKMVKSFEKLSVASVTTTSSSSDNNDASVQAASKKSVTPPEPAPRSSLRSPSGTKAPQALSITKSPSLSPKSGSFDEISASSPSKHWGPEKVLEIRRVSASQGLGISIVGGKLEPQTGDTQPLSGIFIKNVLPGSPAAALGVLNTGDRILAVGDIDLRTASHDMAVEAIRQAGNPLRLCVQSLRMWAEDDDPDEEMILPGDLDRTVGGEELVFPDSLALGSPRKVSPPEEFASPRMDVNLPSSPPTPSPRTEASLDVANNDFQKAESIESDMTTTDSEEVDQQGQDTLDNGLVIDRASAAFLTKSMSDSEIEDEFGYTSDKIQRKYGKQDGIPMYVRLNKGTQGLGISLSGHKDRALMSVMVAGLHPQGNAARDGQMRVGDTLLEVNGLVLHNRCHLNASTVIKNRPEAGVTFILLRRDSGVEEVAVKPVVQFPSLLEENTIDRYRKYKGLRQVVLLKGDTGLGIMIVEGKHQESGTGVFISDLQEGSVADRAGLQVGDMILAVNNEDFVGASYETAAKVLKKTEGEIKMIVCNPNLPDKVLSKQDAVAAQAQAAPESPPEKPALPPKPTIAPKPSLTAAPTPGANNAVNKEKKEPAKAAAAPSPKVAVKVDPTKCEIVPGTDTTIEIVKDKDEEGKPMGLGLSIVGGSDTLLGAIFIHEVYEAGAAHKDGRLRPGDQILEVSDPQMQSRSLTNKNSLVFR